MPNSAFSEQEWLVGLSTSMNSTLQLLSCCITVEVRQSSFGLTKWLLGKSIIHKRNKDNFFGHNDFKKIWLKEEEAILSKTS